MARKVILDVDPGIDDAVAMCLALFDPRLEVVAVTATAGNVSAEQATRNVQAIIEQLDPPRWPRIGVAREPDTGRPTDSSHLYGVDGLGNSKFEVSELHNRHPSDKVICDEVRAAPDEISIIALGPLTNIARAFTRDPEIVSMVGQLHCMAGSLEYGDVTPAAEFNVYCDPESARAIFNSPTTKTLIPLDVTRQVVMTYDQLDELPDEGSPVGRLLRRVMPYAFRAYRMHMGLEGIYLNDTVALVAAVHPELFHMETMAGDVETSGNLTTGATIFDRRPAPEWRSNMDVATEIDVAGVVDAILRGLSTGRG